MTIKDEVTREFARHRSEMTRIRDRHMAMGTPGGEVLAEMLEAALEMNGAMLVVNDEPRGRLQ